jgi:CRISPR/Cas system CSM-associated protein Csm3 (group 7 of RAMP superfamily)
VNGRRDVVVRHEVTGTLETVTALRAGGWGSSAYADLVVARDGLGRLMIPGTSLAGALRSWLGSVTASAGGALFDQAALGAVFGDLEHQGQDGMVCRVMVDDAVAAADVSAGIRDGVGIDRGTGSAAAGVLYQYEVVPPGIRFAVRITAAQTATDTERVGSALDLLVQALAAGRVEIGAARTRGLGQVQLTGITRTRVDLTERDQVLSWLCGRPAAAPATDVALPGDGRLGIEVTWAPVTPVMVRASTVNEGEPDRDRAVDTVPLRSAAGPDGSTALLLPGSSVKGVLRSHAERIVRTITAVGDMPDRWLDQVNDPRLGPVTALFGTAGDHRPGDDAPRPGRRGALSVRDCLGTATAERVSTHVAVDRWTGGAAENLLFSVQEPASADWQPIRMSLETARAGRPADADGGQALALLLLVLRDLADGWLALGFGGTRGRGSVRVSQVAFTGQGLTGVWTALPGRTLAEIIDDPPDGVRRAFAAWQQGAAT